jgi:ATP-dependent DNA helicase PIF1
MSQKIELSSQFVQAFEAIEQTRKHIFLTGKAGTGKSTLLSYFRTQTKKQVVVLAPTGVAALNVHGQTIHSFCKFKPDITLEKVKRIVAVTDPDNIYARIDTIVIDEISMVRADLLDCVDTFLRINTGNPTEPFGGIQMIFIGDLYQLPPVVSSSEKEIFKTYYPSPYFFSAHVFGLITLEFIELEKIYRQKDQSFIALLNAIRNNSVTEEQIETINERFEPEFEPSGEAFFIYLTTTNAFAAQINERELDKLAEKLFVYESVQRGNFDERSYPTDRELLLKVGAQVMMLNNDSEGRWVNGTIGKITSIKKDPEAGMDVLLVLLPDGTEEAVYPHTWELFSFSFDKDKKQLVSETTGTFTQYPLRLAWAVTIHKSQGKTFDRVILDIGRGTFSHGQLYVALSRVTSFSGLILKKPIAKKHVWMDWNVVKFVTRFQYQISEEAFSLSDKIAMIEEAIANGEALEIVYLKANDVKSKRVIRPQEVGEMQFKGKSYLGVNGFDALRKDYRVFRVDRILEMEKKR